MQLNEGSQQSRQHRPAIDLCKIERLKKLARETEILAMELVCDIYGSVTGSGHPEPPVPDDGGGSTNGLRRRSENGEGTSLHGSGHQEPPVPIVDALVCMAHGAKEICKGCDSLS
jgi:hypothetical protein